LIRKNFFMSSETKSGNQTESLGTMPRPVPPEERWTDRHKLVGFYASDELRAWIEEEMERTGKSKTQVIGDALEEVRHAGTARGKHSRRPRNEP
jgi:hypothetical protein